VRSEETVVCPFCIEGAIQHPDSESSPGSEDPREYSVLVQVYDGQGEMLSRRVVSVGAVKPGETRKFTLRVEMYLPESATPSVASSRRSRIE
jgi:hypothetical protein